MITETSKKLFNANEEFLSNLKTILKQKGFEFDLKPIKRHLHLYRFYANDKAYFLSIYVSLGSFWKISSNWQEITHLIPSKNTKCAVILLQKPSGEDYPSGFLIPSNDLIKMKSGFSINRMGLIKINKKDLSLKHQFNNWDSFFQLLKL